MSSQDMRELINIVDEARKTGSPDVEYIDDKDKVTVKLKGAESGPITKLSNQYMEIKKLEKELKDKKDALTPEIKDSIDELFDASDALKTKYIETVKNTITITKDISPSEKEEFDAEGFFSELSELVDKEIYQTLLDIKEKYTNIKKSSGRRGSIRDVKVKENNHNDSNFVKNLKNWVTDYVKKINRKLSTFDSKLNKLKRKYKVHRFT